MLTLPGYIRLKAISADQIAGFIIGEVSLYKHSAWITSLAVHPDFRRHGIARALLSTCEAKIGSRLINLCVRVTNQPALQLYEQVGYKRKRVWQKYYLSGEDAVVMEKER